MVSEEPTDGRCNANAGSDKEGYCEAYPVNGAERCRMHGGKGSGAPEENTNAVTHGIHVNEHTWYSILATDAEREIVDNVFASYLERYRNTQGEVDAGDEWELFFCAVSIGKEIHGEKWAAEKPNSLESGNSLIDEETKYTQDGREYHEYKTTVVQKAANSLSNRRRKWLKDLGLLEDPESQKADSVSTLAEVLSED